MDRTRDVAREIARIYCRLTPTGIEALSEILVPFKYAKGDVVLPEGHICEHMYFVDKGMVRQYYYKNGKELTEHFCCEDDVFICIESFLRQKPSHLVVEALENCVIYGIPHDPLLHLASECYEIEKVYRGLLENSLILSQKKMDMFRFESAHERYNRLLREQPEIVKRAPLSYIASFLLMTPETLSRVRANVV